ncbi:MAG: cellulase family glycosylhydrolase [Planctomycetota bacterium]
MNKLPRWRGFNLLEKFSVERGNGPFVEQDFDWIADWGFNFVRLPMDYRCWIVDGDVRRFNEKALMDIDQAVEFGRQRGVHVNLNFHRAPGYSVNKVAQEPFNLWTDESAQAACELHWRTFAKRYKGIPSDDLSFNLFNEPAQVGRDGLTRESHEAVVRRMVKAIHEEDADRLVIADGVQWGRAPLPELADLPIGQSTRFYEPGWLTHHKASWVNADPNAPAPVWPRTDPSGKTFDIDHLREYWRPWKEIIEQGVGVHAGEGGSFSHTPHTTVLAWLRDAMMVMQEIGIGWALWNLRGSFGILDSQRKDVKYEEFYGHQLDRQMLDLLLEF